MKFLLSLICPKIGLKILVKNTRSIFKTLWQRCKFVQPILISVTKIKELNAASTGTCNFWLPVFNEKLVLFLFCNSTR